MSFVYTGALNAMMAGDLALDTADIRAILVTADYVASESDNYLSTIVAGDRVGSAVALTGETVSSAVFDASDVTFTAVAAGDIAAALVLYEHNASEAAARLIAYIDNADGFPITTNGGDITVTFDGGARKIFKLSTTA